MVRRCLLEFELPNAASALPSVPSMVLPSMSEVAVQHHDHVVEEHRLEGAFL